MGNETVLVTGGAGFIGSHIVDELIKRGNKVIIYDNLDPQVHGVEQSNPEYLNKEAEFIKADVRDKDKLTEVIKRVDVIFHKAAMVGVGQSMYDIEKYVSVNTLGGAILLDIIANEKHRVRKMIVASSMSIYGEGEYTCEDCGNISPELRPLAQLKEHDWELKCPNCNKNLSPIPTNEKRPVNPTSIYAITKRDHEEMFLVTGKTYEIPTVALRYFNVYGSRQALSNPYTGVAAIFSGRLLNDNPPIIFEDGLQSRDFIHVSDIVQANMLAMEKSEADYEVFNVGTGKKFSIKEIAEGISKKLGKNIEPDIVGKFRKGDVRHCYADNAKIAEKLGFTPKVKFEEDGLDKLIGWVSKQQAEDKVESASRELEDKGLTL